MARILKFNKDKANDAIARMKDEIARTDRDLDNMVEVTCNWFRMLKAKYGDEHPRHTELRNFDTIVATKVVEANEKLYINREEGFIGTSLKRTNSLPTVPTSTMPLCSTATELIKVIRISGQDVPMGETGKKQRLKKKKPKSSSASSFQTPTTNGRFTMFAYRDGKDGFYYIVRFNVTFTCFRDREYDLTQGKPFSRRRLLHEANSERRSGGHQNYPETRPETQKILFVEKDFQYCDYQRPPQSMGNILSKNEIQRIGLKSHAVLPWADAKYGSTTMSTA